VRGVIGFYCCKTTVEFGGAATQPAMIVSVSVTMLAKGDYGVCNSNAHG
jgi:hypothetical protein